MATDTSGQCLVLWDIDHTLIETRGVGRRLYWRAFEIVTGVPVTKKAEVTGRTEHAILDETLRLHQIEPTEELHARYAVELAKQYDESRQELLSVGRSLPGAGDALAALARQPRMIQTVLTGNLRAVAEIKLQVFGLDAYVDFDIDAYSDDHVERFELVAIAQLRAGAKHAVVFHRRNTVIVGDSIHDLRAAEHGGAAFVGVAFSETSTRAFRAARPDVIVLSDLNHADQAIIAVAQR